VASGNAGADPLFTRALPGRPTGADLHEALGAHYAERRFVRVVPMEDAPTVLDPETLADTNDMELFVYENRDLGHLLLVARLDNLGKGASGQAVQNLDLMLGLSDEGATTGSRGRRRRSDVVSGKALRRAFPPIFAAQPAEVSRSKRFNRSESNASSAPRTPTPRHTSFS
jgi:hypothetical protein